MIKKKVKPKTIVTRAHVTSISQRYYSSVGLITIKSIKTSSEGSKEIIYYGTGTLIAPNIVITAAHNIDAKSSAGVEVKELTFSPGLTKNEYSNIGIVKVVTWFNHPNYKPVSSGEYNIENDVSLLVLEQPILIEGGYVLCKVLDDSELMSGDFMIAGYPGEFSKQGELLKEIGLENEKKFIPFMMRLTGKILKISAEKIVHKIKVSEGQSGSGIIKYLQGTQSLLVGIHCASTNDFSHAARITSEKISWINEIKKSYEKLDKAFEEQRNIIKNKVDEACKKLQNSSRKIIDLHHIATGAQGSVTRCYDSYNLQNLAKKVSNFSGSLFDEKIAFEEINIILKLIEYQSHDRWDVNSIAPEAYPFPFVYYLDYKPGESFEYIMEFGDCTLDTFVEYIKQNKLELTPQITRDIYFYLKKSIGILRDKKIYHRDIKPGNVIISESMIPKLTDYGISKELKENEGEFGKFTVCGTPEFCCSAIADAFKENKNSCEFDIWKGELESLSKLMAYLGQAESDIIEFIESNFDNLEKKESMNLFLNFYEPTALKNFLSKHKNELRLFEMNQTIQEVIEEDQERDPFRIPKFFIKIHAKEDALIWLRGFSEFMEPNAYNEFKCKELEAKLHFSFEEYQEAVELYIKLLGFLEKENQDVDLNKKYEIFSIIGECYFLMKDFEKSNEYLLEAKELSNSLSEESLSKYIKSHLRLAKLYSKFGMVEKANSNFELALKGISAIDEDSFDYYQNLLFEKVKHERKYTLYSKFDITIQQLSSLQEKFHASDIDKIKTKYQIGKYCCQTGLNSQLFSIFPPNKDVNVPSTDNISDLGDFHLLYSKIQKLASAWKDNLDYLFQAQNYFLRLHKPTHKQALQIKLEISLYYFHTKEYQVSLNLIQEYLQSKKWNNWEDLYLKGLWHHARVNQKIGYLRQAKSDIEKCLKIMQEFKMDHTPAFIDLLQDSAKIYIDLGEYDDGVKFIKEYESRMVNQKGEMDFQIYKSSLLYSRLNLAKFDLVKAEELIKNALSIFLSKEQMTNYHLYEIMSLWIEVYILSGNFEKALDLLGMTHSLVSQHKGAGTLELADHFGKMKDMYGILGDESKELEFGEYEVEVLGNVFRDYPISQIPKLEELARKFGILNNLEKAKFYAQKSINLREKDGTVSKNDKIIKNC